MENSGVSDVFRLHAKKIISIDDVKQKYSALKEENLPEDVRLRLKAQGDPLELMLDAVSGMGHRAHESPSYFRTVRPYLGGWWSGPCGINDPLNVRICLSLHALDAFRNSRGDTAEAKDIRETLYARAASNCRDMHSEVMDHRIRPLLLPQTQRPAVVHHLIFRQAH